MCTAHITRVFLQMLFPGKKIQNEKVGCPERELNQQNNTARLSILIPCIFFSFTWFFLCVVRFWLFSIIIIAFFIFVKRRKYIMVTTQSKVTPIAVFLNLNLLSETLFRRRLQQLQWNLQQSISCVAKVSSIVTYYFSLSCSFCFLRKGVLLILPNPFDLTLLIYCVMQEWFEIINNIFQPEAFRHFLSHGQIMELSLFIFPSPASHLSSLLVSSPWVDSVFVQISYRHQQISSS